MAAGLTIVVYGVITVLLVMLIVTLMPSDCSVSQREGFVDAAATTTPTPLSTNACPQGSKSYIDARGNLNCCSGAVNGHTCDGTVVCTFSDGNTAVAFCGSYVPKVATAVAAVLKLEPTLPVRTETPTPDQVNGAKNAFEILLYVYKVRYYRNLISQSTAQEGKSKLEAVTNAYKTLMIDTEQWKKNFFEKADNTAIAKEVLYQIKQWVKVEALESPTATQEELTRAQGFITAAVFSNDPNELKRSQDAANLFEQQAKEKGLL